MTNAVTLTDKLPEIISEAWDEIVEVLQRYFADYSDEDCPDWDDLDNYYSLHEIVDSAVPIYTRDLDELAYFHHRDAMAALEERFGEIGGDWPMGPFAAGLYCLIDEGLRESWADEAEDLWTQWQEESLAAQEEREAALTPEQRNPSLCQ